MPFLPLSPRACGTACASVVSSGASQHVFCIIAFAADVSTAPLARAF